MPDTVNGFRYLHEAYTATDPHYTGKVTVPTLWDKKTKRIVNNESSEIIRMLNSEFRGIPATTPTSTRSRCAPRSTASTSSSITNVNNGVYRCGFAKSQAAYEAAYDALFATLDELEARLAPALSRRQPDHRSRLAAVSDAGALRRRLFLAVQVQQASGSPTIRTSRTTCASSTRCPASPTTVKPRYYVINYYSIPQRQSDRHHPKGTPVDLGQPHDRARLAA